MGPSCLKRPDLNSKAVIDKEPGANPTGDVTRESQFVAVAGFSSNEILRNLRLRRQRELRHQQQVIHQHIALVGNKGLDLP